MKLLFDPQTLKIKKYVKAAIQNYYGTDLDWMHQAQVIEDEMHSIDSATWIDSH
ncbi:MAG: hypothetical protein GVX96_02375 [Bacteroidetes bacterium]|nr:hypothetical protein [Bacteroidota bacterium]